MQLDLGSARIITVRELARDTSAVLREVNESGEPAVVTRHGKFVALIAPLAGVKLELAALELMTSALPAVEELDDEAHDTSQPLDQFVEEIRGERHGS